MFEQLFGFPHNLLVVVLTVVFVGESVGIDAQVFVLSFPSVLSNCSIVSFAGSSVFSLL